MIRDVVAISKKSLRWKIIRYWGENTGRSAYNDYGMLTDCDIRDVFIFKLWKFFAFHRHFDLWFLWLPLMILLGFYGKLLFETQGYWMLLPVYLMISTSIAAFITSDEDKIYTAVGITIGGPVLIPAALIVSAVVFLLGELVEIFESTGRIRLLKDLTIGSVFEVTGRILWKIFIFLVVLAVFGVIVYLFLYERERLFKLLITLLIYVGSAVLILGLLVVYMSSAKVVKRVNYETGQTLVEKHGLPNPPGKPIKKAEVTLFRYIFFRAKEKICKPVKFVD